jgi:DNA helicase HerA-like ATPase
MGLYKMKSFKPIDELRIGQIIEVTGTKIKVEISGSVAELTRSYDGRVYPIGQIGSVVKVHFGRRIIFGFVTLLRMKSDELLEMGTPIPADSDQRLMEVEMFAEGSWSFSNSSLSFHRGVKTYPLPRQGVFLLTRDEAAFLYQAAEGNRDDIVVNPLIPFAKYSGTESTVCRANIDKMFGMHCALLGSTGSGKSGAVAALLHSILDHDPVENEDFSPQIVIIDPHGEYGSAFGNRAIVYRAYEAIGGEDLPGEEISLPYWLMSADEFRTLVIGKTEYEATSQNNIIYKAMTHARMVTAGIVDPAPTEFGWDAPAVGLSHDEPRPSNGIDPSLISTFDRDKPLPFSLSELENHIRYVQAGRVQNGLVQTITATDFAKNFRSLLDKLNVLKRDPRISFLMKEWNENTDLDLGQILAQFVGIQNENDRKKDIRIIDISGLPNEVAGPLTAAISRLLFQYKVYQTQPEREQDPLLIVCEEAHRYVPNQGEAQYAVAQTAVRRIAREGRKYGIGLLLVSQRPADIESTVISQCGTWVVLRLTNSADQQHVSRFLPDGLSGMVSALPALAQQEALFVGEGAALPARIRINDLPKEKLPRSMNIPFAEGWAKQRLSLDELNSIAIRMEGSDRNGEGIPILENAAINEQGDDIPF